MSQKSCDDFFYKQCNLYFKYLHVEIADLNEFFSYLCYLSSGLKLLQSQNSYSASICGPLRGSKYSRYATAGSCLSDVMGKLVI